LGKSLKKSVEGTFTLKGLGGYSFNGLKRKQKTKKRGDKSSSFERFYE